VEAKYGSMWGSWCTVPHTGASLWKNIWIGWETFSSHTRLVLGDGSWIQFWHDQWCGDMMLKEEFPVLYSIAREKDASVAANVDFLGGALQWNVIFSREVHDWELDVVNALFRNCSLLLFKAGFKINCGGFLPKKELLKSKISSELYLGQKGEVSLGRVCGGPSLHLGLRSLCGRRCSGKFLLWII
jgi:hypothetical protein